MTLPLPRLAIGAIVKNEAPYLLEWIAFHRVLGVTASSSPTTARPTGAARCSRRSMRRASCATCPSPTGPAVRPQLPAYRAILARHGGEADWIAFIDADEFLLPAAGPFPGALPRLLARLGADPGVGAVVVNWALYGSSGHLAAGPGPVIERFARRAERALLPNHHFKSILRTAAGAAVGGNPHAFRLAPAVPRGARRRPRPRRRMPSASTA